MLPSVEGMTECQRLFATVSQAAVYDPKADKFTLVDVTGVGPKNPGYVEGFFIELLDGDRLHLRFTFGGGPGRAGVENIVVRRVRPG